MRALTFQDVAQVLCCGSVIHFPKISQESLNVSAKLSEFFIAQFGVAIATMSKIPAAAMITKYRTVTMYEHILVVLELA